MERAAIRSRLPHGRAQHRNNVASATCASVSGGQNNTARGTSSSVNGGNGTTASTTDKHPNTHN